MPAPIEKQWLLLDSVKRGKKNRLSTKALHDVVNGHLERYPGNDAKWDKRSVERQMEKFRDSPVFQIECETDGNTNYWWWPDKANAAPFPMDPPEALTIQIAMDLLRNFLPESMMQGLLPRIHKAKKILEQMGVTGISGIKHFPNKVRIVPRGQSRSPVVVKPEVLKTTFDALLNKQRLKINYLSANAENPKSHILNPLGFVTRFDMFYLVCTRETTDREKANTVMQFLLHRMAAAELLDIPATIPDNFDLDEHIKSDRAFEYDLNDDNKIALKALFPKTTANYVNERKFAPNQSLTPQPDGRLLLEATVYDTRDLQWELLMFGNDVEVTEPPELRQRFRKIAAEMAARYGV